MNGLAQDFAEQMVTLVEQGSREANGTPEPLKICQKGSWNEYKVFAMLPWTCHLEKFFHHALIDTFMPLSFVVAMFNVRYILFHQHHPEENGFKLAIAVVTL